MRGLAAVALLCLVSTVAAQTSSLSSLPLNDIQLPEGFSIALYSQTPVRKARQLALSGNDSRVVYVGSTADTVVALVDVDGTGRNVSAVTLLSGLNSPNGVAWHEGTLYVAEISRITSYPNADATTVALQPLPNGTVVAQNWNPSQDDHAVHYIKVGPDGLLYVPQGSPSNTGPCNRFENITQCALNRMSLDGTDIHTFATGIRNSVGYDWDLEGNLWASSNGRDQLDPDHDNRPDDPLNFLPAGTEPDTLDFGFPYCHWQGEGNPLDRNVGPGFTILDDVNTPPNVNSNASFTAYCENNQVNQPPAQALGPHVAALGVTFYHGSAFPEEYNGTLFNAQHGSWDRDPPIGYRVMNAGVSSNGSTTSYSIFAQGWLQPNGSSWGRPVDVLPLTDGSLLVSDDSANAVYRISYDGSSTVQASSVAAG
ncbi:hypothetical protein WJX73_000282 [Symbiochloris irregularis]|uniref:Pyrroloquinoline quinone-dependent pyranose dehydrogenase beta-propeller domain-containing protein n=1 Tax=Symbiochloris irregularis TaxID=706552 RepID=A0AAW1P3F0_9CHLO